jgi:hypothetical protein
MKDLIKSYLRGLESRLRAKGVFDPDTLAELESHLLDSIEANLRRGLNQAQAEEETLRRFGSAHMVASTFERERSFPMQKIALALAALSGLFITYVDSRPTWDDTGITAGVILLVCGALALFGYRRPWLLALAVGGWIPLYGLFVTHNYGSVLALIVAFAGAYAGWLLRMGLNRILHPA